MRAATCRSYGPPEVVRLEEVAAPAPGSGDVLVRVHAAAVTAADARIRGSRFPSGFTPFARLAFGVRRPRRPILGNAVSGVVETVGTRVTEFDVGDAVTGMTGVRMGGHAEHVVVPAKKVTSLPPEVTHEDAAALLFGGTTALSFLRDKTTVEPGHSVLVNGASGAVGNSAVQLAVEFGATVTAVCSDRNADLVRSLGADHVVDHATTPVTTLSERYDVVMDTVGTLGHAGRDLLAPDGTLLLVAGNLADGLRAVRGPVRTGAAPERPPDFRTLLDLHREGRLDAVRTETRPLEEIVDLHRLVDSGHKVGNVVVTP